MHKHFQLFILSSCLLFVCTPFMLTGQDWALILPDKIYNYKTLGSEFIDQSIWIDSLTVEGSNQVLHLNRVVVPCTECAEPNLYIKNSPQFLQRRAIAGGDGRYELLSPQTLILYSKSSLGESWEFSAENNLTAEVINMNSVSTFGIVDSTKTILINNLDTILLSKNFGVLKYQDPFSKQEYNLVGIDNSIYGEQVPKFKDYYNFRVGDQLSYLDVMNYVYSYSIYKFRRIITGVQHYEDSTRITYNQKGIRRSQSEFGIYDMDFFDFEGTTLYIDSASHMANMYNHQLITSLDTNTGDIIGFVSFELDQNNKINKKLNEPVEFYDYELKYPNAFNFYNDDYLSDTLKAYTCGYGYRHYWLEHHLGQTADLETCSEIKEGIELIGYISGPDTVGTVITNIVETSADIGVQIYPNPFTNSVTVQFDKTNIRDPYLLEIYNINGQRIQETKLEHNKSQLNLSHFPNGIYILRVSSKYGYIYRKIVKHE